MAIKTIDEIMESLNIVVGEDNSDSVLELMTDIRDTLNSANVDKIKELEEKIVETDNNWRKKYREAFLSGSESTEEKYEEEKKPRKYEDLFD